MVRRDRLFEDSHYNVMRVSDGEKDKLKARLYIKFTDESDVDYDESARYRSIATITSSVIILVSI